MTSHYCRMLLPKSGSPGSRPLLTRTASGFSLILVATSCAATVPKDAATLTGQVSVGIERMQAQTEAIIHAVGDVERGILDEKWEYIYHSSEVRYFQQHQIASGAALTEEQRNDIAVTAASIRESILDAIASKESELLQLSRQNAEHVVEINEVVERYMLSLQKLQESRDKAKELVGRITGVPLDRLIGTVKTRLNGLGE